MKSKALIIGLVWPEPDTTAAGSRMMQLIRFFSEGGWDLHFASTAAQGEHSCPLEPYGVISHRIELNDSSFDSWVEKLGPDLVIFDRFVTEEQFSWRVREQCPSAIRILDTEDLHLLREARRMALREGTPDFKRHLLNETALRELASLFRSDLSLIISEFELELLTEHFGIDERLLHYLPFLVHGYEIGEAAAFPDFSERRDFMCMGNWKHGPNKDAVLFLKERIWPLIRRRLPQANLHVYGAYGGSFGESMNDPGTGFLVRGWADSKREACARHRVCLAPLRYGAGLKGKLIDSMLFGIPNVTTPIGAEGMSGDMDWNGYVTEDPEEFAGLAVDLYEQEEIWKDCQQRGFELLRSRFLKEPFEENFRIRLEELSAELSAHRNRNLTGALLWHHGALSTKYLSKWIEAKNKA